MQRSGAIRPRERRAAYARASAKILSSPETSELAKLSETTYFGLMVAWAQEIERHCDRWNADYDEIVSFYEEIKFFPPVKYFPGLIGGHCVMPNIEILKQSQPSEILEAIEQSNGKKTARETELPWDAPVAARGAA